MRILKTDSDDYNVIQAFRLPDTTAANHTTLTIGAASASTAALLEGMYRISSTVDCHIVQGAPATVSHLPIPANQPEYFAINGVVSAIAASAGTLTLTKV